MVKQNAMENWKVKKKVILFETLCKRESKDGYFIMKGIRTKSDIEAGIGYSNIIGGMAFW